MTTVSVATNKELTVREFAQLFADKDEFTIQKGVNLRIIDVDDHATEQINLSQRNPNDINTPISLLFNRLLQPVGKELILKDFLGSFDLEKRSITLPARDQDIKLKVQEITKVFSTEDFTNGFIKKNTNEPQVIDKIINGFLAPVKNLLASPFEAALPLFHTYYYTGSVSKRSNEDFRFNIEVKDQGLGNSSLMRINACATLRLHMWCSKAWKEEKYVRAYALNLFIKPLAALFDAVANVALLVIKICAAIFILIGKAIQKIWNPSSEQTSFAIRWNLSYQMGATATSLAYLIYQALTQTSINWAGPSGDAFFDVEDSLFPVENSGEVLDENRKRYLSEVCSWTLS